MMMNHIYLILWAYSYLLTDTPDVRIKGNQASPTTTKSRSRLSPANGGILLSLHINWPPLPAGRQRLVAPREDAPE